VEKMCQIKLVYWIFFQCVSIFNHVGVLCILPDIVEKFENFEKFKEVALFLGLLYGILQVYFLFGIIQLSATNHVIDRGLRQQVTRIHYNDKPPSYEEAMEVFAIEEVV
jgi:hypothetical protein